MPATIAMASAGVIDALSWPVLAVCLSGGEDGSVRGWLAGMALLASYVLVMVCVVRRALVWGRDRPVP